MKLHRNRLRVGFILVAFACATAAATGAGSLKATLLDPKDAPAYVSACSVDNDTSGVFTPSITVSDRKAAAIAATDVAIDFLDAQNRLLGEVVATPPYGPQGLPFGAVDRIACKVKRAQFVDGSVYQPKVPQSGNSLAPIAGAALGVGGAALLLGSGHSGGAGSTNSATPAPGVSAGIGTPVPVASIVPLDRHVAPHPH
ncbi:MAG: hypothetical protein IAI49_11695 [Candidatus Eremiobacteraeota bacterium]|nr:hypothetical protein [Candidatus Eremiobacteraeota bacterium]